MSVKGDIMTSIIYAVSGPLFTLISPVCTRFYKHGFMYKVKR